MAGFKVRLGDGSEIGPMDLAALRTWLAQGLVDGDSPVMRPGSRKWVPLSTIAELKGAVGASRPKAKAKARRAKQSEEPEPQDEADLAPSAVDRVRVRVVCGLLLAAAASLGFLAFRPTDALSAFDGAPWLELALGALALGLALVPGWDFARKLVRIVLILAAFALSRPAAASGCSGASVYTSFGMMVPRPSFLALGVTLLLSGCVPAIIRRPAPPAPPAPVPQRALNTSGPWALALAPSERVTIDTRAVVTIASDTVTRVDTIRSMLGASYVWESPARRRVDGLLADYRVSVGGASPAAPAGLQVNGSFSATRSGAGAGLLFSLPAESSACTAPTLSALQGLFDAWIPLPDTLVIGREWADTLFRLQNLQPTS